MSVIIFELTDNHVKLLKQLRWSINKDNIISGVSDEGDELAPPFGENNIYDAMDLIINGKPDDFNPFDTEDIREYTTEEKTKWDDLYKSLPMALDIVLFNGHFETGTYRSQYHNRVWKKNTK